MPPAAGLSLRDWKDRLNQSPLRIGQHHQTRYTPNNPDRNHSTMGDTP
jgi:hypothetical protein